MKKGYFLTAVIGAVIGSLITLMIAPAFLFKDLDKKDSTLEDKNASSSQKITVSDVDTTGIYKEVAKKSMPSVVGITTTTIQEDFFLGPRKAQGVGTGVIVDKKGYILTNSHVIGDGQAKNVNVLFYDGSQEDATVLWNDTSLDLAIIKVTKNDLSVADLGDSDKIEVGDIAIAIGNPLGLEFERTLTQGVISGLHRSIQINEYEAIEDLMQTDASINPGNSGGPLLNSNGQVIGINTAKIQSGEGLGFAIPINIAKPIVDQFIEKGEFKRVYLGIKGVNVAQFEAITGTDLGAKEGVYVAQVTQNSPGSKAGLKAGDIIVKIEDKEIKTMSNLTRELYKFRPSDKAKVTLNRGGNNITIEVQF